MASALACRLKVEKPPLRHAAWPMLALSGPADKVCVTIDERLYIDQTAWKMTIKAQSNNKVLVVNDGRFVEVLCFNSLNGDKTPGRTGKHLRTCVPWYPAHDFCDS